MARMPPHPAALFRYSRSLAQDPNIRPVGNGHQFSYQRVLGPEQLSPRSSSSSSNADAESSLSKSAQSRNVARPPVAESSVDESDSDTNPGDTYDDEDDNGYDDHDDRDDHDRDDCDVGKNDSRNDDKAKDGVDEDKREQDKDEKVHSRLGLRLATESASESMSQADSEAETSRDQPWADSAFSSTLVCDFVIEEIDAMDSGCEGLEILHPTEIESNRSRSRSRHKDFDGGMVRDFKNLNCSNETSDNEDESPAGFDGEMLFHQRQMEMRRNRRVSMSSSFGKRTHSELSDSDDSDAGTLDVNDVGSSARRMPKRLHRVSLMFQDPPAPRIDELDEPDSGEEELASADPLARELPYWTMEVMEMDSA
ncbi:uncharacterized protein UV8b_07441 [Ustilaginoidea virens]|uniref:Uncharacterized protein n=1 Tax=Ustilaginoidea virens TaxID=1159556 RepID=A0A1B5KUV8_USTVR|nr:uncharacterized protein UV8b_07441 [Ustilaginoidea virens]QUC23200.1 hypothetical protein UV8b_07441 [Ustilaginoidea virens]GAO14286.1 hypothetical protein UVI_02033650 [Ustilaginoidea virens]